MEDLIDVFAAYSPLAKEQGGSLRGAGHDGSGRDTGSDRRANTGGGNAAGGEGEIEATVKDVFDGYSGSGGFLARENVGLCLWHALNLHLSFFCSWSSIACSLPFLGSHRPCMSVTPKLTTPLSLTVALCFVHAVEPHGKRMSFVRRKPLCPSALLHFRIAHGSLTVRSAPRKWRFILYFLISTLPVIELPEPLGSARHGISSSLPMK